MTRFDEALQSFAERSEWDMAARVGSAPNRYVTVQEVGRGRTRRLALQSVASIAAVAVVGAGVWYAAGQLRTPTPAGPPVSEVTWLGDPADIANSKIVCGVPLPVDVGEKVTTASAGQEVPKLKVTVTAGDEPRVLDLSPGATTLPTEDGVTVEAAATWEGAEPQFWGLTSFGVLVDGEGNVVARTSQVQPWNADTGELAAATDAFTSGSCAAAGEDVQSTAPDFLDGPYTIHVVTQMWVDNRRNAVVQWVDPGLPAGAEITFDHDAYLALLDQQADAAEQQLQDATDRVREAGTALSELTGTGVTARMNVCEVAGSLANGGLAAIPAIPATIPTAPIEVTASDFSWTFDKDSDPGWDGSYDFIMVFTKPDGTYVSTASARPDSTSQSAEGSTSRATFEDPGAFYDCDQPLAVPTQPGTYNAYLMVAGPALDSSLAPEQLRDLGGFTNLNSWIPAGTLTIP